MTTYLGSASNIRPRTVCSSAGLHKLACMGGFTLFEYLVALIVSSIAMTSAVPSFVGLVQSNRLSTQTNTLVGTLRLARSEAVRRGEQVVICPSNAARTDCGSDASAWGNGWLVRTSGGDAIREVPAMHGGPSLSGSSGLEVGLAFNAMGEPVVSGQFMLCKEVGGSDAREVDINEIGRIRVTRHDAGNEHCGQAA